MYDEIFNFWLISRIRFSYDYQSFYLRHEINEMVKDM